MNVNWLVVALVWIATGMSASGAFAAATGSPVDEDSSTVFGSATLSALQNVSGSAKVDASSALVGADTLRAASGNIGINLAAGALNAQANQIALLTTPRAGIVTQQDVQSSATLNGSSTAQLGAGSLVGASGNVGVNIASGAGNAQVNALVIH